MERTFFVNLFLISQLHFSVFELLRMRLAGGCVTCVVHIDMSAVPRGTDTWRNEIRLRFTRLLPAVFMQVQHTEPTLSNDNNLRQILVILIIPSKVTGLRQCIIFCIGDSLIYFQINVRYFNGRLLKFRFSNLARFRSLMVDSCGDDYCMFTNFCQFNVNSVIVFCLSGSKSARPICFVLLIATTLFIIFLINNTTSCK